MREEIGKTAIDTMLTHLFLALKYCSIYQDLRGLEYDPDHDEVIATYSVLHWDDDQKKMIRGKEYHVNINVACDSNAAIIKDVVDRLQAFFG